MKASKKISFMRHIVIIGIPYFILGIAFVWEIWSYGFPGADTIYFGPPDLDLSTQIGSLFIIGSVIKAYLMDGEKEYQWSIPLEVLFLLTFVFLCGILGHSVLALLVLIMGGLHFLGIY